MLTWNIQAFKTFRKNLPYLPFSRFPEKTDEWLCLFSGKMCPSGALYSTSKEAPRSKFYLFAQTFFAIKPSSKLFCLCSESKGWITVLIKVSVWYLCYSSSYSWLVNKELKIGHRLSSPVVFGDCPVYGKVLKILSDSVFWLIPTFQSRFFFKRLSKLDADDKISWIVVFAQHVIRHGREVRPLVTLELFSA